MAEHRYFLRGEIDIATTPEVRSDLRAIVVETTNDLVVDCCGLIFIDSTGISVLAAVARLLRGQGRRFRLVNTTDATDRMLEILGLTDLLRGPSE